jgi:hypothetical protein
VFGGFTVLSLKRGQTFIIWFYPPLLDYDISMHGIVELVVVNPTSPRSYKRSPDAQVIVVFVLKSLPGRIVRQVFAG